MVGISVADASSVVDFNGPVWVISRAELEGLLKLKAEQGLIAAAVARRTKAGDTMIDED